MVEVLIAIMGIIFAFTYFIEKATKFIQHLKSFKTEKLKNGFEARLLVAPLNKKSEASGSSTSFTNDNLE